MSLFKNRRTYSRNNTARNNTARNNTARNNTARNNTARNNTARNNTARNNTARNNTVRNNTYLPPSSGTSKSGAPRWPSANSKSNAAVPSYGNRYNSSNTSRSGRTSSVPSNGMVKTNNNNPSNGKKEEKKGKSVFGNIAQGITNLGNGVKNKVTGAADTVKNTARETFGTVLEKGKEGANWLKEKGGKAKEGVKEALGTVLEKGKEGVNWLKDKGNKAKEGAKEALGTVLERGKEGANWLKEKGSKTVEGAKELLGDVLEKGKDGVNWLKEKGSKTVEGARELFANALEKGKDGVNWLKDKGNKALEGAKELWDRGKEGAKGLWEKGKEGAKGLWEKGKEGAVGLWGKAKSAVKGTWNDFKGTAMETFGNMLDVGIDTWKDVKGAYNENWGEASKNRDPEAKERTGWDKCWDFAGKVLGSGVKLTNKLGTELKAGGTKFASQGVARVADMVSPEAGDKIREAGDFASELVRTMGNQRADILGDVVHGAIAGDSIENPNASQIAGQVIMGFIPIAGQIADARDVVGGAVAKDPVRFGTSLIGFIPGLGDGLKQLKHADEAAGVMKHVGKLTDVMKNSKLGKKASGLLGKMKGSKFAKGVGELAENIKGSSVAKKAGDLWSGGKKAVGDLWSGTKKKAGDLWSGGKKAVGDLWTGAKEGTEKGVKGLWEKVPKGPREWIGNKAKGVKEWVTSKFSKGTKEAGKEVVQNGEKVTKDVVETVGNGNQMPTTEQLHEAVSEWGEYQNKLAPSKTKADKFNTATVTYDINTGEYYYGMNRGVKLSGDELNADLSKMLPEKSLNNYKVGNCAEVDAVNQALNNGANISDLTLYTINTKTGLSKEMCENCVYTFSDYVNAVISN